MLGNSTVLSSPADLRTCFRRTIHQQKPPSTAQRLGNLLLPSEPSQYR